VGTANEEKLNIAVDGVMVLAVCRLEYQKDPVKRLGEVKEYRSVQTVVGELRAQRMLANKTDIHRE
jgi:hypothetical protein